MSKTDDYLQFVDFNEKIFFHEKTDIIEIINITNALPSKSTAGLDEISVNLLKSTIYYIAQPMVYIINKSFQSGVFPDDLKIA